VSNRWRERMLFVVSDIMGLWRLVVKSSATAIFFKNYHECVGKLTRFRVQFVWHVFFTVYVFNNIIISHPFQEKM
jgi:hypothetical protein